MEYIHLFETASEFNEAYNGPDYKEPWVSFTEENSTVNYNNIPQHDYSKDYFTVKALGSGTIHWSRKGMEVPSYRINGGEWCSDSTVGYYDIPVNENDEVEFSYNPSNVDFYNFITVNTDYEVYGNIFSLMYGDDFEGVTTFNKNLTFQGMFDSSSTLVSAENLILPATTLIASAYTVMFKGCSSLTTVPSTLPATSLTSSCYREMFGSCTSLTSAPTLPATALTDSCYWGMFKNCSSLTTAPALPATVLLSHCYYEMFMGCTSLATSPTLSATSLANSCYLRMFCGCTSLTTAPELPATTLASSCYGAMFSGCTNLNYIKCLATNISAQGCTYYWVSGVASTGTFVKDVNMSDWTTGNDGIPSGWAVEVV